jgi:hypothetical protein
MNPVSRRSLFRVVFAAVFAASLSIGAQAERTDPFYIYLVLGEEGHKEIAVQWHTMAQAEASLVHYDTQTREGDPAAYAHTAEGSAHVIEGLEDGRQVHGVMLTDLTPNTVYYFVAGDPSVGYSAEKSFRTPPDKAPVRFIQGGDMHVLPSTRALTKLAGQYDPAFCVVGGDIAYADGDLRRIRQWDAWFDIWTENMVTPDGHLIPMVQAIGNHEVNREESEDFHVRAPFYMGWFWTQGDKPYFVRRIGDLISFIVLDTGHLVPYEDQVDFLREQLEAHADFPAVFPVYHVTFYPSARSFDDSRSVRGREHWMPLFEEHGIRVAFEHHDHTLKRTHPLLGGEINPNGIVYIGDGSFGVPTREIRPNWYLDVAESIQHFWLATVDEEQIHLVAIDTEGNFVDNVAISLDAGARAAVAVE